MNNMKILVTGCCGFIGFNLTSKLLADGFDVVGIDDMNDHYDVKIKKARLEKVRTIPGKFKFLKLDINNYKILDRLVSGQQFSHIINLAARAGVRNSLEDPWIYFKTNVVGLLNILELMKKHNIQNLIQASSSSVYGNNNVPFSEDDFTDTPLSPYAASKKATEPLCYSYFYLYKFNITVFRFFTVYGPFGRPDMSVFRFIKWIDEGKELKVFGNGMQLRDFTYVDDIADGIVMAMRIKKFNIINLGDNNPTSLDKVIKLIEKYLGKKARIKYYPANPSDIFKTCAKIHRANKILDWSPNIKIEEGIKKTVEWYLQNINWARKIKLD